MRHTFEDLVAVMARLRGPGGCPWDREQTHTSLAPYLLEETHETLEAISRGDLVALRDELGDLLLQVVFHGQMAHEAGTFDTSDVVDGLVRKLISRHPHVFGDVRADTPAEVLDRWHELKRREMPERGIFDGVPASLPALSRAQKLLARAAVNEGAASRGPEAAAVAAAEVRAAVDASAVAVSAASAGGKSGAAGALGDLLLAVAALAAAAGVDAESALREACERFVGRPLPVLIQAPGVRSTRGPGDGTAHRCVGGKGRPMNNNDTSHVKNLSSDELRAIVQDAVEQALLDLLGDPDHGLEVREDVQERLRQSMERLGKGARGLPADEVAKRLGLNW